MASLPMSSSPTLSILTTANMACLRSTTRIVYATRLPESKASEQLPISHQYLLHLPPLSDNAAFRIQRIRLRARIKSWRRRRRTRTRHLVVVLAAHTCFQARESSKRDISRPTLRPSHSSSTRMRRRSVRLGQARDPGLPVTAFPTLPAPWDHRCSLNIIALPPEAWRIQPIQQSHPSAATCRAVRCTTLSTSPIKLLNRFLSPSLPFNPPEPPWPTRTHKLLQQSSPHRQY